MAIHSSILALRISWIEKPGIHICMYVCVKYIYICIFMYMYIYKYIYEYQSFLLKVNLRCVHSNYLMWNKEGLETTKYKLQLGNSHTKKYFYSTFVSFCNCVGGLQNNERVTQTSNNKKDLYCKASTTRKYAPPPPVLFTLRDLQACKDLLPQRIGSNGQSRLLERGEIIRKKKFLMTLRGDIIINV